MTRTKLTPTIAAVAAALAVAVAPAAPAATPSKPTGASAKAGRGPKTAPKHRIRARSPRPLPRFTRNDVVYVWVDSSSNSEHAVKCAQSEIFLNNELGEAQEAYESGNYGDISGHLTQASKIAAGAVKAGCDVSW